MSNSYRESPTIVWNAAGLSPVLTGIERLALAYSRALSVTNPEVTQVLIAEKRYGWLQELPATVGVRYVPHLPATISTPRWVGRLGSAAWHSWANTMIPRVGLSRQFSFTVHDWTAFESGSMKLRHKMIWQAALTSNLLAASAVHFTTQESYDSTPAQFQNLLKKKRVLIGGDVPTLPEASKRAPERSQYVIAVGTNIPRKRFAETVALWKSDWMEGQPHLVLAGKGTEALGRSPRHTGMGYVSDAELSDLVAGAKAAICFSDREGLNLPAREALRAGVPVIGTRSALGTLEDVIGVTVTETLEWNFEALGRQLVDALSAISTYESRGIKIGSNLGDEDVLIDFLLARAHSLVSQG